MKRSLFRSPVRSCLAIMLAATCAMVTLGQESRPRPAQTTAPPAPNTPITLDEAIGLALENNPALKASSQQVEAASGRSQQAGLWANPDLVVSVEEWPVDRGGSFSDAIQTIGIQQTVPYPGKKRLEQQIGTTGLRQSQTALDLHRIEITRDVKTAFSQVLAAERLVEVAHQLVEVAEVSAATARKRVAAGAVADPEQLRAEIPMEQARTELAGFERELLSARQTLAWLLGRENADSLELVGSLEVEPDLELLSRGPDTWLPSHPNVLTARTTKNRAELELRRARLEPYPDVQVGIAGGRAGETDQSIIALGFSLPLPLIDTSKGRKKEAAANVRIAEANETAVQQRLLRDWFTARKRFQTALEQVNGYRDRILPKANEALRLMQLGFEQGKFNFIDLLDTQRTTAEARLSYQQKLLELRMAQIEIEALIQGTTLNLNNP